jgi:hypothetical protein
MVFKYQKSEKKKRPEDKVEQLKDALISGEKSSGRVLRAFNYLMRKDEEEERDEKGGGKPA